MIRKKVFLLLFILLVSINTYADETLINIIRDRDWDKLPSLFLDNSYTSLQDNFSFFKSIKIEKGKFGKFVYIMKFKNHGEIGIVLFNKKNGKYLNLQITNRIRPLNFVDKFNKYKANNVKINVGDAQIHFIKGVFYEAHPFNTLILFEGKWNFSIEPNDKEEKLTLNRIFRKKRFSKLNTTGIFLLKDRNFLKSLPSDNENSDLDLELKTLYNFFQSRYGFHIKLYNQYWHMQTFNELNFIVFNNNKNSYYYYIYNRNNAPDTQLTANDGKQIILSYNANKEMKISFRAPRKISELKLNLHLDPEIKSITGTTTFSYENIHSLNTLRLGNEMQLINDPASGTRYLNIFRRGISYYFSGLNKKTFSFSFTGQMDSDEKDLELFKLKKESIRNIKKAWLDSFYYLSRIQNYYPNPGNDFFKSDVTISVPRGLNCLASGNLVEKKSGDRNTYRFTSPSSKGISLIAGDFYPYKTIKANIPIKMYKAPSFKRTKKIISSDTKKATNLFIQTFGKPDLKEIKVLIKRGLWEGGISNTGFVIISLPVPKSKLMTNIYQADQAEDTTKYTPIGIRNQTEDHIIHELAHQWWGGVISWKSYRDVWLTEGLSHFSVLYYFKKKMSEKKFMRVIKNIKRWVFRNKDKGPIIYGTRIHTIYKDYEAYQSIIYNKSALVFFMLMDLIGEEDFMKRLRSVLDQYRYQSITSMQFIEQFSKNNQLILNFLKNWIYSREIPIIKLELAKDDKLYDKKKMKRIVLYINQLNTDFIFPLKLKVTTFKGSSVESIIVKKKKQKFIISRNTEIRSVTIYDSPTLIKEKKRYSTYR